ncbi:MAG: ATP-binding protein [Methanomassiliicoccaceae archaeon]|nr:ATP-binding protein [Methanomassiliicoccaceae archaeon]
MKEIDSPPTAAALMESTRSIGYSFESAISDIIDNSISASAKRIWITSLPSEDPYVAILDDGEGLKQEDLQIAMRYGADPNMVRTEDDLGRFGLGMKMASLSQCRKLTVVSKTDAGFAACRWDLDRVIETDQWTLQLPSLEEVDNCPQMFMLKTLEHGTLVIWENLDKIRGRAVDLQESMNETLVSCRSHLCLHFHMYMSSKKNPVNIFMNNNKLEPLDPFLSDNTLTSIMPSQTVEINGQKVVVTPYVLPPESKMTPQDIAKIGGAQRNLQGFWVYRNRRLIIPGTWFKLSRSKELTKLARVRVEIPNSMDSIWDIDVKKSSASVPDQFRKEFENVLERVISKSERKYTFRGRKESDSSKNYVWNKVALNKSYTYELNMEHPVIKEGYDKLEDDAKTWFRDVMKLVAKSIPYNDIFCTMGESKLVITEDADDEEEYIGQGIRLLEKGVAMDILRFTEPFMNNPNVIRKLEEYNESR